MKLQLHLVGNRLSNTKPQLILWAYHYILTMLSICYLYIITLKSCKVEIISLSMFSCMCSKSSNADVITGKIFHAFHAVFMPLLSNVDVVAHLLNVWNMWGVVKIF